MDVEDEEEDDDVEEDMMRWMSRMRRKMMMLRRKTDPKTGKHTLCEPARSKCTGTGDKSLFVWKFTPKNGWGHLWGQRFVRACAVEMHMGISQEQFCMEIYKKNVRGHLWGQRFVRACAIETHMDL